MEATAEEIKQNREAMFARMDREDANVKRCPTCNSPRKQNRWFYRTDGIGSLVQCENFDFHAKSRKRAQMTRQDWYFVLTLLVFANAMMFDGGKIGGMLLMGAAILLVVLVDGFGVQL